MTHFVPTRDFAFCAARGGSEDSPFARSTSRSWCRDLALALMALLDLTKASRYSARRLESGKFQHAMSQQAVAPYVMMRCDLPVHIPLESVDLI